MKIRFAIHTLRSGLHHIILVLATASCVVLASCSMDAGRYLIVYPKSRIPISGHLLALHNEQVLLQPEDRLSNSLEYRGRRLEAQAARAKQWEVIQSSVSRIRLEDIDSVRVVGDNHIAGDALTGVGTGLAVTVLFSAASQNETKRTSMSMKDLDLGQWLLVGTFMGVSCGLTGLIIGLIRTTSEEMLYPSDTDFRSVLIEASAFSDDAPEELDRIAPLEIPK